MRHAQSGVSLLLVGVVLILIVGAILAFLALFSTSHGAATVADTATRLTRAQTALEQFAGSTGRLPCPANGTLDTGDEDRGGGSLGTCNSVPGTLPWHTIGLRHDDGLDAWGWKISYRVYTGAAGSLTQDNGASMVNCTIGALASPGLGPTGLCPAIAPAGNHADRNEFVAGKGLTVNDYGTVRSDAAFVLVSHGPTGLGSYTSAGVQQAMPVNTDEVSNTTATGPYVARAAVTVGLLASDPNFFDDLIAYRSIFDLAANANLSARNWETNVVLNTATVAEILGPSFDPTNLGQTLTLNNGRVTLSVQAAGVVENLTLGNSAGLDGIGGAVGGTTLSSADSEVLHVAFNTTAQMFAVTLDGFGCRPTTGSCTDFDVVQFTFTKGGVPVGSPITKQACNSLNVASFTIDLGASPGGDFDGVDIAPQAATPSAVPTQILVGGFVNCPEGGTCVTTLDTGPGPGGNHCP
jgi:hypothetical protein